MKDLVSLTTRKEVHDFVRSLFKSDSFQESYDSKGFIYEQVDRFAYMPRFFAETSNDELERAHFSTWWNVIILREYDNPYIQDLYYLHEMAHAATMPYTEQAPGRAAFDEKMQRNELEASVLSEIAVYFELPELRKRSFDHAIYADQFLEVPHYHRLWEHNKVVALETMRTARRDIMVGRNENDLDLAERWIRKFAEQNAAYSVVWSERYHEVEEQMAVFQSVAMVDREAATIIHGKWLSGLMKADPIDGIPFRQEAELFAPFYWANKARYEKAMANE